MARPLRIQYEDALYHVTCRGNERKAIFRDDHDKKVFLALLNEGLITYNVILYDLSTGIDIKEKVIGGSILGSDTFIKWARDKFLPAKSREIPAVRRLNKYAAKEVIIDALCRETKKSFDEIKKERGVIRQIAMDLLYRAGGLSGTEIGEMMAVDYSTVSQGRKRLRERLKDDKRISQIIKRVETDLSKIKI